MASLNVSMSSPEASSSSTGFTPSPATRPVTSRARGVCQYYTDPRGCYAKDKCKFLHSEPPKEGEPPVLTPYDSSKTCRFYLQGYCKRGDKCWFQHTESKDKGKGPDTLEEEDDLCSICFEKPMTYGLLSGCSHIFCLNCIKQWRDPSNKPGSVIDSGNTKRCPMCREPSRFITPSSKFWRDDTPEKLRTIEAYRESMGKIPCRYFHKSLLKDKNKPLCPFGKDCFYEHKKEDGTIHEFKDGAEVSLRRYHAARHSGPRNPFNFLAGGDYEGEMVNIIPFWGGLDFDQLRTTTNASGASGAQRQGQILHDALLASTLEALRTRVTQQATASRDRSQASGTRTGAPSNDNTGAVRSGSNRASDASRPSRAGGVPRPSETDDMIHLTRLVDILRDQLGSDQPVAFAAPPAPPMEPRVTGHWAGNRSRTTTRNGSAAVADEGDESDDDEPPPQLISPEQPRFSTTRARSGYDSDNSMPALQVISDSSDDEDNVGVGSDDASEDGAEDDELEDEDEFDPGTFNPDLFFREVFGVPLDARAPDLRPRSHVQTPDSRPSSSARFSTVVSRSASGSEATSANGSTPAAPSSRSSGVGNDPPMRLMEWAEGILRMDEEEDSDDDDEPMPLLEPVPHSDAIPTSSLLRPPVSSRDVRLRQTQEQNPPQHPAVDTESNNPLPPPDDTLASVPAPSRQPSTLNPLTSHSSPSTVQMEPGPALSPVEGGPPRKAERKASAQQEFTTDGRGRVISIGGPEPIASASFAEAQPSDHHLKSRSDLVKEAVEEVPHSLVPTPIQRKSSEFMTDGRGRVISVGHSVSTGSSSVAESLNGDGPGSTGARADGQESRERGSGGGDGGGGRGLFAWFNALF